MPTYQYRCTECGHELEKFQSFHDDPLVHCPECSGRLRKVFNAVGVVFKGSGFYRTDNRSGSTSSLPAASSGSTSAGDGASSGSTAASGSDSSTPSSSTAAAS